MISKLAYVHPDAKIGNNVTIEPFAYIAGDVVIGDDCWIGPSAAIYDGARIGKGCKIHMAASIACTPQDMKFKGEVTTAEIGDYNEIREYVTIAHDCVVGDHNVIVNRVSLGGEVHIGNWVVIGGHTAVHQWVRIGDHAMVQGMSGVTKDIPPFITTSNKDYYAGINKIGLSRRGFTPEQITAVHEACRILFQSNLNYMEGCDRVEAELPPSAERDMLVQFIRSSKRGCIKQYVSDAD